MEIETSITRRKYMNLLWLLYLRQWSFKFVAVLFFFSVIFSLLTQDFIPTIILIVLMALVYSVTILYMGLSPKNKNFFLRTHFTFDNDKIIEKNPVGESTVKWEAIINWKKVGGFYLLYLSSATFFVVQKSDIPAGEIAAFENLLRTKIKKTK